jgi:hypothetical protein
MYMKKMNMVEKYECVKALLMGETPTLNGEPIQFSVEDAIEFLDGRKEQTIKKNATSATADRKPTKTQLENEGIKAEILAYLATCDAPATIGEIGKAIGIESNQKVSALVTQMLTVRKGVAVADGKIERTEIKGKAHFTLA